MPVLLAFLSASCFLALAHAAVNADPAVFGRSTVAMAAAAALLVPVAPAAGVSLLGPVLLARRLSLPGATVPATVEELLERRP